MSYEKKWQKYPESIPKPTCISSHSSDLYWITVEYTEGERTGERVVSIARLTNIDIPGYLPLWEYWGTNQTIDHWGSGRKVIAWKSFAIPEPYYM